MCFYLDDKLQTKGVLLLDAIIHAFAFGSPVFEPKLNVFLLQLWKLLPVIRVE